MKNLLLLLLILVIVLNTKAQYNSASVTAAGLTCAMCTKAIYKGLQNIKGVKEVDVDIKSSAFNVKYEDGATVDPDALKKAVEDAGFSVARLELSGPDTNVVIIDKVSRSKKSKQKK